MSGHRPSTRRASTIALVVCLSATVGLAVAQEGPSGEEDPAAVLSPAAEKFRALTGADGKTKAETEEEKKNRPPFEFYRTQVAPSDVVPYMKANHWGTLGLDLRANRGDFEGRLQMVPVRLRDMPHEVVFSREARLLKEQEATLTMQFLAPRLRRERSELSLELTLPGAIRPDGATSAFLQRIRPHQMLIPVLGADAQAYESWRFFQAALPASGDRDPAAAARLRYYIFLAAQNPEDPLPLPPHPLTWTSISHVIWDTFDPNELNLAQQDAMVDWLHWGGQLVIVAGAGPSLNPLLDSFLAPYLPARPSGANASLDGEALGPFLREYPTPAWPTEEDTSVSRYVDPDVEATPPILLPSVKPATLYFTGLQPMPGATVLPLPGATDRAMGVEWRVGRGRVLILAFRPVDGALKGWGGLDTFVRRVVLRRPADPAAGNGFAMISAEDATWLRYAARDIGAPKLTESDEADGGPMPGEIVPPSQSVAAWLDDAALPVEARKTLETASGISVPGSGFVLRVIGAYLLALVPLNWLVCRFVFRRRELAWVLTPVLALGFAVAVERAAAYDMGYDLGCDEIDVVEIQGTYPRAHLSRFAALFSTGRTAFSASFPDDLSALALPMNLGANRYQRGEDAGRSEWQSYPVPALSGFSVQPRSLSMLRAEQMDDLPGGIELIDPEGTPKVRNATGLELREAVVVHRLGGYAYLLGTIPPGGTVELDRPVPVGQLNAPLEGAPASPPDSGPAEAASEVRWIDPGPILRLLRDTAFHRPEDLAEWRLVAWTPSHRPGMVLAPAVDRHRGMTFVLAHLDYGPTPPPGALLYVGNDPEPYRPPPPVQGLTTPRFGPGQFPPGMLPPPTYPPAPP